MSLPDTILCWPLNDGTWRDSDDSSFTYAKETASEAQNYGTPTVGSGSILRACPGPLDLGMIPGSDGSVWLACSSALLEFSTESFSFNFYHRATKTDGAGSTNEVMSLWSATDAAKHYKIQRINETSRYKLRFAYWNGSSVETILDTSWIDTDRFSWKCFGLRRSGNTYQWFVDGSLDTENLSGPSSLQGSGGAFYIFSDGTTTNALIYGALARIEVWSQALGADDFQELADRKSELERFGHRRFFPKPGTTRLSRLQNSAAVNVAPHSSTPSETDITSKAAPSHVPFSYMRDFNGSSSYISYGTTDVNVDYPALAFWVVLDDDHISGVQVLAGRYDDSPLEGYRLYVDGDILKWEVVEDTDNSLICEFDLLGSSSGVIEKGPLLVVGVCTYYRTSLFVNGHMVDKRIPASTPLVVDYDQSDTPIILGRNSRSASEYFDGSLAEFLATGASFGAWDAWSAWAASRDPVTGLMNTNRNGNPEAVYNFENDSGSSVVDATGNGHTGTVVGTVSLVNAAISNKGRAHDQDSSNYIYYPSFFDINADFSWLIWFTLNTISIQNTLLCKGDFPSTPTAMLRVSNSNVLEMFVSTDSSNYLRMTAKPFESQTFQTGVLYFVMAVFRYTSKEINLVTFDHPALVTSTTGSGTYTGGTNTRSLLQGVANDAHNNPLDGNVEALAIYERALHLVEGYNIYKAANIKLRA